MQTKERIFLGHLPWEETITEKRLGGYLEWPTCPHVVAADGCLMVSLEALALETLRPWPSGERVSDCCMAPELINTKAGSESITELLGNKALGGGEAYVTPVCI